MRYQRLIECRLREALASHAAVELIGPAQCGKSSLALLVASSADVLDACKEVPAQEGVRQGEEFVRGVRVDPSVVLRGADPHAVIDAHCVTAARRTLASYELALAESGTPGALIVTSAWDADGVLAKVHAQVSDVGETFSSEGFVEGETSVAGEHPASAPVSPKGRTPCVSLRMLPLSLQELGLSSGRVSLAGLFEGEERPSELLAPAGGGEGAPWLAGATSADLARIICRGGWPGLGELEDDEACAEAALLGRRLVHEGAERSRLTAEGADGCVWALARCLGEIPTYERIASGIEAMVGRRPARDTVRRYLRELERMQVTLPVLGWTPPGRARVRARTKPKQYFVDPSLPAALLGATADSLATHPLQLQALLTNLVARDLHVYLEAIGGGRVCHYLDDNGVSVDFVLERRVAGSLSWAGVQVALSDATVDEAAHDLLALARKSRGVAPAFLAVVTGQGAEAYRRDDGVWVVPVTCLGA